MYIYLDIVENFQCEMCGACCRNDWTVTVDETSYRRNADLFADKGKSGEFNQAFVRLNDPGPGEYAYIAKRPNGVCWFLDGENLCVLHREAGHSQLDSVCQTFPRYPMNTARGVELTLSFSCPSVIRLATRLAPLQIVRSQQQPIALGENNYVVAVYPKQQSVSSPLHRYFEIEQHFIDIMQCRGLPLGERLNLLKNVVKQLSSVAQGEDMSQSLNLIFRQNYEWLDSRAEAAVCGGQAIPSSEILVENFFVNFIFKKAFYIYGLSKAMRLMEHMWKQIANARTGAGNLSQDMLCTEKTIIELEFQFGHNRSALLAKIHEI